MLNIELCIFYCMKQVVLCMSYTEKKSQNTKRKVSVQQKSKYLCLLSFQCMSPAYLPLHCSNGECGPILTGQASQCPLPCSIHEQCASCLATPQCGWCAFGGLNGLGICMEGGLTGPKQGLCSAENVTYGDQPLPGMRKKRSRRINVDSHVQQCESTEGVNHCCCLRRRRRWRRLRGDLPYVDPLVKVFQRCNISERNIHRSFIFIP